MTKQLLILAMTGLLTVPAVQGQNIRQSYSGKFGFYAPGDGLNNGLMIGVDGITEFLHYDFSLNLTADAYLKQSFNFFQDPKPEIVRQQILLIPIHAGAAYKVLDIPDAESRVYLGAGAGYYLYFYTLDYRSSSGGLLGSTFTQSGSRNNGNFIAAVFARVLIGRVFVEPKLYFASRDEAEIGSHRMVVNPSGFSIALGFQY